MYGKIVNGKLYKAPREMYHDMHYYSGVPEHIYKIYGYKKIELVNSPNTTGYIYSWHEELDCIKQVWEPATLPLVEEFSYESLDFDPGEVLRKARGKFGLEILAVENTLKERKELYLEKVEKELSDKSLNWVVDFMCNILKRDRKEFFLSFDWQEFRYYEEFLILKLQMEGYYGNLTDQVIAVTDNGNFYNNVFELFRNGEIKIDNEIPDNFEWTTTNNITIKDKKVYLLNRHDCINLKTNERYNSFFAESTFHWISIDYKKIYTANEFNTMIYVYLYSIFDDFLQGMATFFLTIEKTKYRNFKINIDNILNLKNVNELNKIILEEKIKDFSFMAIKEKINLIRKNITDTKLDYNSLLDDLIVFCEIRNCLVHSRGNLTNVSKEKIMKTRYAKEYESREVVVPTYEEVTEAIEKIKYNCNLIYSEIKRENNL